MCASRIVPPQAHGWLPQFTPSPRMYASSSEIKNSQRLRRPFVTGWAGIFPARAIDKTVERAILRKDPASEGPIGHSLIWRSFSGGPAALLAAGSLLFANRVHLVRIGSTRLHATSFRPCGMSKSSSMLQPDGRGGSESNNNRQY